MIVARLITARFWIKSFYCYLMYNLASWWQGLQLVQCQSWLRVREAASLLNWIVDCVLLYFSPIYQFSLFEFGLLEEVHLLHRAGLGERLALKDKPQALRWDRCEKRRHLPAKDYLSYFLNDLESASCWFSHHLVSCWIYWRERQ